MVIAVKISLGKIDKARLYKGERDTYMDLILMDKESQYDDGFVVQQVSKEERQQGLRLEPCGSFKFLAGKPEPLPRPKPQFKKPEQKPLEEDEIPW